ncbi:uncharacterized protein LOC124442906 [Xenia sp. Carnegie-2017]|uniref:uncharacterized protein LOC124442906 n=1 Tax=Xenia sp. Carnegie-2017 TaxID=2897299 RepID=UPI001F04545F|nr:uncharacterized protein LOC124442906 [Xenia sp. Carnegie-2017]
MDELVLLAEDQLKINVEKMKNRFIKFQVVAVDFMSSHFDSIVNGAWNCTYGDLVNTTLINAQHFIKWIEKKLEKVILTIYLVPYFAKYDKFELYEFVTANIYQNALKFYTTTKLYYAVAISLSYSTIENSVETLKRKFLVLRDGHLSNVTMTKLNEIRDVSINKTLDLLKKLTKDASLLVSNLKTETMKVQEKLYNNLKTFIFKYRTMLLKTLQSSQTEILNTINLYKDIPIEEIYRNMQTKGSEALNNIFRVVTNETLTLYQSAMMKFIEILEIYERNKLVIEEKMKMFNTLVQNLTTQYGYLATESYEKISLYYHNHIQTLTSAHASNMKNLMVSLSEQYEHFKIWFEHVKPMKLKEFYNSMKKYFENSTLSIKACCDKKFKVLLDDIESLRMKFYNFINETATESINVLEKIRQVNKEVKKDFITTLTPYEKIARYVYNKQRRKALKNIALIVKKYDEMYTKCRNITEMMANQSQHVIVNTILSSVKQNPLLIQVAKLYKTISEFQLLSTIVETLNKVRTHKTWTAIEQEILHHEAVFVSKVLGKSFLRKLKEVHVLSQSVLTLRNIRNMSHNGFQYLQTVTMTEIENITTAIMVKSNELYLNLRNTFDKLMSKANDFYVKKNKLFFGMFERLGEISILEIEEKLHQHIRNFQAPVHDMYKNLSIFVVNEVMILDNYIRKLLKGFEIVKKHLASLNTNIKNHYEDIYMTVNRWGKRVLNIVSFDFAKFGYRPTELVELLNFHVKQGWVLGKRFVNEYVSIYNLTKLTPNELLHILKVLPNKFEQVFHTTRKSFDRCIIMLKEVKESVNDKKMTELKEKAESIMNNTRDQMHFLATETLETIVFVTKFYGSVDTVYSANPELVQLANFHVQRIINSTQVCKATALNLYTKISENVARFLNQTSFMYHNDLPRLVKYIKMEWHDLDAAGKLKKIENVMSISMLIGSNLIKETYTEARISFDHYKDKLINYVNVKNSEVLTKLNETKTWLMQCLGSNIEKMTTKVYKELWYRYNYTVLNVFEVKNQLKMIIRNYIEHLSKLPESAKISFRQWQLTFDNIRKDLNTLINDSTVKLQNGGLYVTDKVLPLVKENCMSYINKLKNKLSFLSKKTEDAVKLIISDIQEDLPIFKKKIVDIFYIVRASEIAFITGDLELNIEQLVELRTILTDLYNLTAKKCGVFHARLYNLYQSCVTCCEKIISWALDQCNMTTRQLYQHISINLKPKLGEIRKSIVTKLTTFSKSIDRKFAEITRMQQKLVDMCHEKAKIVYNKSVELRQITLENIRIILKQLKVLADDLQKRADLIKLQTKLRMEQFEKNIYRTNKNFTEIMNENRDVIQEKITGIIRSLDMRSFLNQYVDIEDLNNKTIEIGEDVMNIRMVKDVVDLSKACYSEGQRLLKLSHETSEFVMYLIKRIVKYSDVWEIVETLTDPFHWIPPSDSVAMIFGKPHVYTFDGHSYQFIGYKKPSCTYVLAHDFRDNNFTLMSQETALIINTKSGYVKIHANGKVEATVSKDVDGNDVKTTHYELPVEMQDLSVRREGSYVKIHHDTGVDIACDVKHFLCTFNINKFYHGRLAGLLGTNNNEQYDEFLKPDKTIAKSVAEFANAWEVSGDRECKVSSSERKPTCKTEPSPRCKDLFLSSTSPLAKYFKSLDPAPFYKACQYDTSDCQSVPSNLSFCNVTAAYTTLLRKKGIWASQLQECANCGSKGVWVKWTEHGNNNVDVVLMIPDTLKMKNHTVQLSGFLKELENELRSNYTSRYAVVAFGGKTAFLQRPHIVTNGGKIFGSIKNVESTIASMQFNGQGANALEAIEYLAQLPFQPGASKVVIMLSTQNRETMTKAPLLKAKKELNMQGIIFNVIGPYFKRSEHKDVLGLWKGKAMVKKSLFHSKEKTIGLPANDHIRLAEYTKGAVFNLKAYSQVHGNWLRLLKRAMKTTIVKQIQEDQTYCRQCVCVPGLTVEPLTICRTNRHSRCT